MQALNRKLALVLWAEDEEGEEDVAIFSGTLVAKGGRYFLERDREQATEILEEWLERIQPVPDHLLETLLHCDFQLPLSVGKVESGESMESFGGLEWPR